MKLLTAYDEISGWVSMELVFTQKGLPWERIDGVVSSMGAFFSSQDMSIYKADSKFPNHQ
jgi:hypothetical protein